MCINIKNKVDYKLCKINLSLMITTRNSVIQHFMFNLIFHSKILFKLL